MKKKRNIKRIMNIGIASIAVASAFFSIDAMITNINKPVVYTNISNISDNTTSLPNLISIPNVSTEKASNWTFKRNAIIQEIINNISGLAQDQTLETGDIKLELVDNEPINNLLGQVTFNVTITNGKAQENGIVKDPFVINNVTFSGFKQITPTSVKSNPTFEGIFGDQTAEEVLGDNPQQKLQEVIDSNNLKDKILDGSIDVTSIVIGSTKINSDGSLSAEISLKNYYDEKGELQQGPTSFGMVTIVGFAKNKPTIQVLDSFSMDINSIPSNYLKENPEAFDNNFIFGKINEIFSNLPKNFTIENISNVSTKPDDSKGQVIILFNINNYYDGDGILTSTPKSFQITLNGFRKQIISSSNEQTWKWYWIVLTVLVIVLIIGITALVLITWKKLNW